MEYSIKELSEKFGIKASTLRYYEDCGILDGVGRNSSGQRIYQEKHLHRLGAIECFKDAGMTIEQIKRFFIYEADETQHIEDMMELLHGQEKEIVNQIEKLEKAHDHIKRKIRFYGDVQKSIECGTDRPCWSDYKEK